MLLLFCGCAGYQIGNQSLYPSEVHTVYVPIFKSSSFRRNLGERLTEAVVKEIERTTPYKVVNDPNADSILSGSIVQEGKTVLIPDLSGDAREVQANINVQVSWVDRKGRMLRDNKAFRSLGNRRRQRHRQTSWPRSVSRSPPPSKQAICRIAQQIVGLMEKPW